MKTLTSVVKATLKSSVLSTGVSFQGNNMEDIKKKILNFNIHSNGDSSIFISKLMSENGWSKNFTLQALSEYKKFIYLLYISDARLSPSVVIDKIWHCHLTFTQSYWQDLCRDILKKDIHHIPSSLNDISNQQDSLSYERTLKFYQVQFGNPNLKVWSKAKSHKKPWFIIVFSSLFLTACSFNSDAENIFFWVIGLYIIYRIFKWLSKNSSGGNGGSGGGCSSSCGGGGCGGS